MKLELQIKRIKKNIEGLYLPKSAFGNYQLITLIQKCSELQKELKQTQECDECEGSGSVNHICDCSLCDTDYEDCPDCFGLGRTEALT